MIYVDTNVFLYPVLYEEKRRIARLAKKILIKIANGEIKAATSTLTWDEFVWVIMKTLGREIAIREGEKFLIFPNLKFLQINEIVIQKAQKLVEKYEINPRDSIHISCALVNGIKEIISDDLDFNRVKEIKRISINKAARL